jgi:hypothetical protein
MGQIAVELVPMESAAERASIEKRRVENKDREIEQENRALEQRIEKTFAEIREILDRRDAEVMGDICKDLCNGTSNNG